MRISAASFIPSKPIWVGDLRKKNKISCVTFDGRFSRIFGANLIKRKPIACAYCFKCIISMRFVL
jgi:hypothetical protein